MCKCAAAAAQKIYHVVIPVAYPWLGRICAMCHRHLILLDKDRVVEEENSGGFYHRDCMEASELALQKAMELAKVDLAPAELQLMEILHAAREFSENNR